MATIVYKEIVRFMKKHFVTFYSPGTFFQETNTEKIDNWDVNQAIIMADQIIQRHNASPFGFKFTTREHGTNDLDSKQIDQSHMYYLGGTVYTLQEIIDQKDPDNNILIENMKNNHMEKVIINSNSYQWTRVFHDNDILLNYTLPTKRQEIPNDKM